MNLLPPTNRAHGKGIVVRTDYGRLVSENYLEKNRTYNLIVLLIKQWYESYLPRVNVPPCLHVTANRWWLAYIKWVISIWFHLYWSIHLYFSNILKLWRLSQAVLYIYYKVPSPHECQGTWLHIMYLFHFFNNLKLDKESCWYRYCREHRRDLLPSVPAWHRPKPSPSWEQ